MSQEIIAHLVNRIVTEILKQPKKTIAPTDKLISSGLIDSFSLVDLSLMVEDDYGVHIDDTELNADTFDTLEQLASLIEARR